MGLFLCSMITGIVVRTIVASIYLYGTLHSLYYYEEKLEWLQVHKKEKNASVGKIEMFIKDQKWSIKKFKFYNFMKNVLVFTNFISFLTGFILLAVFIHKLIMNNLLSA